MIFRADACCAFGKALTRHAAQGRRKALLIGLLTIQITVPTLAQGCEALTLTDGWVRQPAPVVHMTAAYFTLTNPGAQSLEIHTVSSPVFTHSTLHKSRVEAGQSSMRHLSSIEIGAGKVLVAAPGGVHLMLGGAVRELTEGTAVELVFHCADGTTLQASLPVLKSAPGKH